MFYKLFRLIQWHVFYSQKRFVVIWKELWLSYGGKKVMGWRLINYPNSLLARVLKAKYYPSTDFLNARLGSLPSYTLKSIWATRDFLRKELGWRVGLGQNISIREDIWLPRPIRSRLNVNINEKVKLVSDLIYAHSREWKADLIFNIFPTNLASIILQIPLAMEDHEDVQVWSGEPSREFTVKSVYKLLQDGPNANFLQTNLQDFHKKLWSLHLPPKIKTKVWIISWNYIPTLANLRHRRIVADVVIARFFSGFRNSSFEATKFSE
ncbi:reverse transcriptase [Gossypium australe]|uniref:Reverse transcriptase n=1 Tax=Gossypium australe TaxID=47621 RepID=A0A5B6W5I6_9ROSI|nr:reverse transcriptase [Gossypium australe]